MVPASPQLSCCLYLTSQPRRELRDNGVGEGSTGKVGERHMEAAREGEVRVGVRGSAERPVLND